MTAYRYRLDLQLFSGEKTEKATPKKKSEARSKGQVAKSSDLPGALILFFSCLGFLLFGGFMKDRIFRLFYGVYGHQLHTELSIKGVQSLFSSMMMDVLLILAPIFLICMVVAFLGNFLQIGFLLTGDPLIPKFSKLNPIEGAKKLFGIRALIDLAKTLLKLTVIGVIVYISLDGEKERLMDLSSQSLQSVLKTASSITVMLGIKIGVALSVLGFLDFLYQRFDYEKNLRMSKQDIKDEYKKTEGDPHIKGKIREKQRRMALSRMMQNVPKADVIITNPTHFAVAIQYESGMEAPKVIAKGTDFVALKIREIAKEHGVVTMENRPLARALYAQVEIGQSIPADMFQAVAEVLAYVYRLKGKAK